MSVIAVDPPTAPPVPAVKLDRLIPAAGAACLLAGSLLFLLGGRLHPGISSALGSTPDAFFRAFAHEVAHTRGWTGMHMRILVGPVLWAIGASLLLEKLTSASPRLESTARGALFFSAGLWAVAFALDGFGAPVLASGIVDQASPELLESALLAFQANAVVMSRLGLVSWVVGGAGIVLVSAVLLSAGARTAWRSVVGVLGIAVGTWPLIAALAGPYAAGPFTSAFWLPNAVAVGAWYVALASCAYRLEPARLRE